MTLLERIMANQKFIFFYKKQIELYPNCDIKKFIYPGPKPFSKETSIVMMADSLRQLQKV